MIKELDVQKSTKIKKLVLVNGYTYKDYFIDYVADAPAGFIAIRPLEMVAGEPELITFISVKNIAAFEVEEAEAYNLWATFDPMPETIETT